jgi:uncharacterized protein (TIGR03067 family)
MVMAVHVASLIALLMPTMPTQAQPEPPRQLILKRELQQFQGTWMFESLEENGVKSTADDLKERTFFVGGEAFIIQKGKTILQAGGLQADPSRNPNSLNAMVTVGEHKGEVMLGIYSLDGDTLKFCLDIQGESRPKEFKAGAGTKRLLAVCKRARPKEEKIQITGSYRSESIQANNTKYIADVVIERLGDAYLATYKKGTVTTYVAIGVRQGDVLSLAWANQGQVGVTLYKIEPGPRLVGQYTHLGGIGTISQEILTPAKKLLDARLPDPQLDRYACLPAQFIGR